MNRKFLTVFSIFAIAAFIVASNVANAGSIKIGDKLEGFTLKGTDGKQYLFNDIKGKNGAVVVFLSAQCPVVKTYIERINTLAADYQAKGITFIGINSNSTESLEYVSTHAVENFKFPVLIDTKNVLADQLGATATPEVYFFDAKNVLLYHGAIDNDKSAKNITDMYLKNAFDSVLAGKVIEKPESKAFGCTIKRAE